MKNRILYRYVYESLSLSGTKNLKYSTVHLKMTKITVRIHVPFQHKNGMSTFKKSSSIGFAV